MVWDRHCRYNDLITKTFHIFIKFSWMGSTNEPRSPFGYPMWMAGRLIFGPHSTAFPDTVLGSWTVGKAASTGIGPLIWNAGIITCGGVNHCAKIPSPRLHFCTLNYVNHLSIICMKMLLIPWTNKTFIFWEKIQCIKMHTLCAVINVLNWYFVICGLFRVW